MNKQGPGRIDWTDWTWTPLTGCWGPGGTAERPKRCFYCFAESIAKRFNPYNKVAVDSHTENWANEWDNFKPTFHPERLEEPLRVKAPSKIFVCSTADLFGDWAPREWIEAVLEIVRAAPQHTFQFLTKNPWRLAEFSFPQNAWVGATATDNGSTTLALRGLRLVEAPVRFISFEPLLGHVGLADDQWYQGAVDWLIIGALTGRYKAQYACRREWVEDIERAAARAGVAVWEKDSLAAVLGRPLRKEWPRESSCAGVASVNSLNSSKRNRSRENL